MVKSIKIKENIVTPMDENGYSSNWLQMFIVENDERVYFWIVGMKDNYRVSLEYDNDESAYALEQASSAYLDQLSHIKEITKL